MTPWLETERLVLREPSDADVDACWRIHGDPRTYAHLPSGRMKAASEAVDAPILVGTVHYDGTGRYYNSMILIDANGPLERHDKAILQPFGETMPMRDFFRLFSDYVDLANDFTPGTGPGVVHPNGVPLGVATCYEVAFDRALRGSVENGAQVLTVPTNNATFGRTEMTYQQLAMSQVRAVEHGRSVVVAATSGVSAVIEPDPRSSLSFTARSSRRLCR